MTLQKIEGTDELEILMNAYKKSKSSPEEKQKIPELSPSEGQNRVGFELSLIFLAMLK